MRSFRVRVRDSFWAIFRDIPITLTLILPITLKVVLSIVR
jgi:hypothetical protein